MLRIAIFVDGGNVFHTQYRIDYKELANFLLNKFNQCDNSVIGLKRFYTGAPVEGEVSENESPEEFVGREEKISSQKKFWYTMEEHIGYTIIKRPLKTINKGEKGEFQKGDMDAQIAYELHKFKDEYDVLIFIAGDSDYEPVLKDLANNCGKKIIILSTRKAVAKELIKLTKPALSNIEFIDLDDIRDKVSMERRHVH
ncbi:MAG: NYN domain-containing protein [Candidatus Moraniibacteriota bacterium]|jgi:uncharacterized LabA/DUF88 family protein